MFTAFSSKDLSIFIEIHRSFCSLQTFNGFTPNPAFKLTYGRITTGMGPAGITNECPKSNNFHNFSMARVLNSTPNLALISQSACNCTLMWVKSCITREFGDKGQNNMKSTLVSNPITHFKSNVKSTPCPNRKE